MKLAISNIAWRPADDELLAPRLREAGADAVELAPTAYWPDPLQATKNQLRGLRSFWEDQGLPIVALQSLLFGFPGLSLFDEATRSVMARRLHGMLVVAAELGAGPLVFGSPRNRQRGARPWPEALDVAVPFFRELGEAAASLGVCLCIEPNPPRYGCDFVTGSAEARELVALVGSPGFGLHLDTACMVMADEDPVLEVARGANRPRHVHFSAPELQAPGPTAGIDYGAVASSLRSSGYSGAVSIEMRAAEDPAVRRQAALDAITRLRDLV